MNDAEFERFFAESAPEIERRRSLPGPQRLLHRQILEHFAFTAQPPGPEEFTRWATEIGADATEALAALAGDDVVEANLETGQIIGAYPFVAESRGHRVDISGGSTVEAYCAADALGIAPLLSRDVTIRSNDPYDGASLQVAVRNGKTIATPRDLVVGFPAAASYDPGIGETAAGTVCPTVSFYGSEATALAHGQAQGFPLRCSAWPRRIDWQSPSSAGSSIPPIPVPGAHDAIGEGERVYGRTAESPVRCDLRLLHCLGRAAGLQPPAGTTPRSGHGPGPRHGRRHRDQPGPLPEGSSQRADPPRSLARHAESSPAARLGAPPRTSDPGEPGRGGALGGREVHCGSPAHHLTRSA
jgi:Alkylmercury lyase